MRPPDEGRASHDAWMANADEDLQIAQALLPQGFARGVSFHAQQAAEKALKGYLARLSDEDIPKTHDLLSLSALIAQRGGAQPPVRGLRPLNQHAVTTRYPDEAPPTHAEAAEAVGFAQELVAFVRAAVG